MYMLGQCLATTWVFPEKSVRHLAASKGQSSTYLSLSSKTLHGAVSHRPLQDVHTTQTYHSCQQDLQVSCRCSNQEYHGCHGLGQGTATGHHFSASWSCLSECRRQSPYTATPILSSREVRSRNDISCLQDLVALHERLAATLQVPAMGGNSAHSSLLCPGAPACCRCQVH